MILMFETSVLSCFARADRLDLLAKLTSDSTRRVTTQAVIEEIEKGIPIYPKLVLISQQRWLEKVSVDGLEELAHFAEFSRRLVDQNGRNVGEASALAWIMVNAGVLISDDQDAIQITNEKCIETMRTLRLLGRSVCKGLLTKEDAATLVDELISGGARFPCKGGAEFMSWANREGLFDPVE